MTPDLEHLPPRRVKVDLQGIASGVFLIALGGFFAWFGSDYPLGTLRRMGPGVVPTVLGLVTVAIGLTLLIPALGRPGLLPRMNLRPPLAVAIAIALFALTVTRLGLLPATFLTVVAAACGSIKARPVPTLLLGLGTSVGVWLIFAEGLGMPVPLFGGR